jgi:hypothetical protein
MEDEHNNTPPEDWKGYKFFQEWWFWRIPKMNKFTAILWIE